MNCPRCQGSKNRVRATYQYEEETQRYRQCVDCGQSWTTVELMGNLKIRQGIVVGCDLYGHSVETKL